MRWPWKPEPPSKVVSADASDVGEVFPTSQRLKIPGLESLSDTELARLNDLLPWASFVVDAEGRRFGKAYSHRKRTEPQQVPDRRIVELNQRVDLSDKIVLEAGCFEGHHTVGLAQLAKHVNAFDGRIENVVKTLVRCWAFGAHAHVFHWDVETPPVYEEHLTCDVLHHVGVLYHLADPIGHLQTILPRVSHSVLLDTHIAESGSTTMLHEAESQGFAYRFSQYAECGRDAPFAGLCDEARWVELSDLTRLMKEAGFETVDVCEVRHERNGPRAMIFASRLSGL